MEKLSAHLVEQTLRDSAEQLRDSALEIAHLREENEKLASEIRRRDLDARILKVASAMETKGLNEEYTLEQKLEWLHRPENITQLDAIEQGVDFAAQQVKLAHVEADSHGVEGVSGAAEASFIAGIMD